MLNLHCGKAQSINLVLIKSSSDIFIVLAPDHMADSSVMENLAMMKKNILSWIPFYWNETMKFNRKIFLEYYIML